MSKFLLGSYFAVPNAPFEREIGDGYQWFSLEDRSEEALYNGVKNATSIVNHFIDTKLKELNLKDTQLSLVGFSQGAVLAIHTALTRSQSCASVVAYSGRFLSPSKTAPEIKSKPNICVIHGDADDVVPFSSLDLAVKAVLISIPPDGDDVVERYGDCLWIFAVWRATWPSPATS